MDGQNFQNENEQNYSDASYQSGNTYQDNTYQNNTYQDNTAQYSDPLYMTGNAAGNTAVNNNQYNNAYTDNSNIYNGAAAAEENKTPGTAIASLILGISGILLDCCCGVGALFGIIGLILGIVGNKNKKSGVGTAGIVCSVIALVVGVLMVVYFFVIGGMAYMEEMM